MNQDAKQELTRIVERVKAINAQVQELKWETKELAKAAWDKCGVKAKVVKQLAKEAAWDQVEREAQRQIEESLDQCRAALGLLADLPLGQAATEAHAAGNGKVVEMKRGRGRPKGSKNKPKDEAASAWVRPPVPVDSAPPPVPDFPPEAA